jgi:(p)ppGpp synthase/HD superfamily hydrolase
MLHASMLKSPLADQEPHAYLWQYAAAMAAEAHAGQFSPGSTMPYFAHSARVATLITAQFGSNDPEILATAYLHDVLEKTTLSREALALTMGSQVATWVEWLSKTPGSAKGVYWTRLASAPWQVRLVKMADALDHLNGPPEFTPARLKAARKALALATGSEPEILKAAACLSAAVAALEPASELQGVS